MSGAGARKLAEAVGDLATDPLGYALLNYPWGEPGPLEDFTGPRRWQAELFATIRDHLSNPEKRFTPLRIAVATGHAVGKTAFIAMFVGWGLDTCVDTRIVLAAGSEAQLVTKLSPELGKWRGLGLTKDWFRVDTMSHKSAQRGHEQAWRADLLTWSVSNPESFQGLHNLGRRLIVIFDEASGVDDKIWNTVLPALGDEGTEVIFLAMGNPTRNVGAFFQCFNAHRNLWVTRQIDARQVEGTNRQYLDEIIETYGEDSDIARVRVRGLFPQQSSMTFIRSDVVDAARVRLIPASDILPSEPVIMGVDVARYGGDASVLAIRQGRDARSRPWQTWNGANSIELAGAISEAMRRYRPDYIFVDGTGGYGGGVIDQLRALNPDHEAIFDINFGSSPKGMEATDASGLRILVKNKRAQMWSRLKFWLDRGIIPDDQKLADDLVAPEYTHDLNGAILLERKEHMRARGIASPDRADALCLTFAEEVRKREPDYLNPWSDRWDGGRSDRPYDRYADLDDDDGYSDLERYGSALPSALQRSRYDR